MSKKPYKNTPKNKVSTSVANQNVKNAVVSTVFIAPKNTIQSREQLRAKHALTHIEGIKGKYEDSKIKSAISGLPAMIHMNGLGHAFAFFLSDPKNFPERKEIVEIVFDWLKKESGVFSALNQQNLTALNAITQADLQTYQIAQQEAQAYLLWLKKFARALLVEDK